MAKSVGGGVRLLAPNATLIRCTFTNNTATNNGGGVHDEATNNILTECTFTNNTARSGGAICWSVVGTMNNCNFVNSKSEHSNGINAAKDLNLNGGNGIVYIVTQGTISGTSIVVLNNETYYYPPNSNINFTK